MQDGRKFPRLDARVKVKWTVIARERDDFVEDVNDTKNISEGGICIVMDEKEVDRGCMVKLNFELPTGISIVANGKVIWIAKFEVISPTHAIKYNVGIKFLEISNVDKVRIKQFVLNSFDEIKM